MKQFRADIMQVENHKVNPDGCICVMIEAVNRQKAEEYLDWLFPRGECGRGWFNLEEKRNGVWSNYYEC